MRRPKWVIATYAMLLLLAVMAALPNFLPSQMRDKLPPWATREAVSLGLDLQGGAHLLLAVNREDLAASRLQDLRETVVAEMRLLGLDPAIVRAQDNSLIIPANDDLKTALQSALTRDLQPGSAADFTLAKAGGTLVLTASQAGLDRAATQAADRSLEVIRNRVDQVGVTEAVKIGRAHV